MRVAALGLCAAALLARAAALSARAVDPFLPARTFAVASRSPARPCMPRAACTRIPCTRLHTVRPSRSTSQPSPQSDALTTDSAELDSPRAVYLIHGPYTSQVSAHTRFRAMCDFSICRRPQQHCPSPTQERTRAQVKFLWCAVCALARLTGLAMARWLG